MGKPSTVSFVHDLRYTDLPPDVQHLALNCILDLIGTQVGATTTPCSRITRDYAAAVYGDGNAPLLFDGRRVHPAGAALANAMTIDSLDIHDGERMTKGHVGANVFPAAISALAQKSASAPVTGAEFVASVVLGYELGGRTGIALHATASEYHTSGAWGAVAAAGITARALGLNAEQTRHALGIAEYYGPRSLMMRVIDHPTMLKDGSGWGAMTGVSAGYMAAGGFTGAPATTVEGEAVAGLWGDLGEVWHIRDTYFKPHAVCRWAQAPMEGAVKIAREHRLEPEAIERVVVETFHEATRLNHPRPLDTETAQYSVPFPLASALVHGNLGYRELSGAALNDERVLGLAARVELVEVEDLNKRYPAERLARVFVHTTDARTLESGLVAPRGDPEAPWSDAEFEDKYRWLAEGLITGERAEAILGAVRGLPGLPDVSALIDLLAAPLDGSERPE